MPYLPCSSSSMYSRGDMLSHSSKHSFMALMIILAFYPQPDTPILPVLHTCGVLADSHRCNSINNYSKYARKVGDLWKSTVPHQASRLQKPGQLPWRGVSWQLRLPSDWNPFDFLVLILHIPPTQGQIQILWAWNLDNVGVLLYEKQ